MAADNIRAEAFAAMNHRRECTGVDLQTFIGRLGDELVACRGCRQTAPYHQLVRQAPEKPDERRYHLACVRCDREIRVDRPKPRIPLCKGCKRQQQEGHR